jgi:benzoylformate decarboxylase
MDGSGRRGREALIEQLLVDGIDHMFGNPGTVEQGFLDALRHRSWHLSWMICSR